MSISNLLSPKQTFKIEVKVAAGSQRQAEQVGKELETLAKNIAPDNLKVLAEASKKAGINTKIKTFKHLL